MDNMITGVFGVGIFLLFIGGLAESIGKLPFIIIVVAVGAMALYAFYEETKSGDRY